MTPPGQVKMTFVLAAFLLVFSRGCEGAPRPPIINFHAPKHAFGEGRLRAYRSIDDLTEKELGNGRGGQP